MRICGYARISIDLNEDSDENTSIETQKKRIFDFVKREYPDVDFSMERDIFVDRDKSGYTFEQRLGYQQLKNNLLGGKYDLLVIKDLSRFSRRVSLGAIELEELLSHGIKIIGVDDGLNLDKSIDTLSFIRLIFAEDTVTTTSKKVSNAIAIRQKEGTWLCNAPYGYYIRPDQKGKIFIDEEGAEAVKKIFELYCNGYGYKSIAHYMTEHHYPTGRALMVKQMRERGADVTKMLNHAPINPVWSAVSVSKIVSNDFYIGTLRQGVWKRSGINKNDKRTDKSEHYVFENHHEAIIDMETWRKAQRRAKKSTKHNYSGVTLKKNPYTGILKCLECNSPMFAVGGAGYSYRAGYNCGNYLKHGIKSRYKNTSKRRKIEYTNLGCTGSHYIAEEELNKFIKNYFCKVKIRLVDTLATLDVEKSVQAAEEDKLTATQLKEKQNQLRNEIRYNEKQRIRQIMKAENRENEINVLFDELNDELLCEIDALELKIAFLTDQSAKRKEIKESYQAVIDKFDELLMKDSFEKTDLNPIIREMTVDQNRFITVHLYSDITELFDLAK